MKAKIGGEENQMANENDLIKSKKKQSRDRKPFCKQIEKILFQWFVYRFFRKI